MRPLVLLALLTLACGESNYTQAAVGTGITVGMVGVHRAITDGCWGQCQKGYLCNHETGLCERGECTPPCAVGSHCAKSRHGGVLCEPDPATLRFGSAPSATPRQPIDAGAPDAETGAVSPH